VDRCNPVGHIRFEPWPGSLDQKHHGFRKPTEFQVKNITFAIIIAAAASIAILSPASARQQTGTKTPTYSATCLPLILGIGY
jgi:hypothetical protein